MRSVGKPIAILLVFAAIMATPIVVYAEDGTAYNAIVFGYQKEYAPPTTIQTPLHGTYQFSDITSKFNQPRYVPGVSSYSNPHEGVDQSTDSLELAVYPVLRGRVTQYNNTAGSGSKWLELQLDINADGTWDNLYARYYHLSMIEPSALIIGATFSTSVPVARTGSDHLDWRLLSTINGTRRPVTLYPYFINIGGWNGAQDLDFISVPGFYQNTLTISAYVMNDGVEYQIAPGDLVLYWRIAGTTSWNGPVTLSQNPNGSYTYNVGGHGTAGTQLDIIIRARRSDQSGATNYRYGWFPPKYNQPPVDPNASDGTISRSYMRIIVGTNTAFVVGNQ